MPLVPSLLKLKGNLHTCFLCCSEQFSSSFCHVFKGIDHRIRHLCGLHLGICGIIFQSSPTIQQHHEDVGVTGAIVFLKVWGRGILYFNTAGFNFTRCDEEPDKKEALVSASGLVDKMNTILPNFTLQAPSNVIRERMNTTEIFAEVGVVSEAELTALLQRTQDLDIEKLKVSGVTSADGLWDHLGQDFPEKSSIFLISLRNLPCGEIHAMRRMRVASTRGVMMQDLLLEARRQLVDSQHIKVHEHALQTRAKGMPTGFKERNGMRHLLDVKDIAEVVCRKQAEQDKKRRQEEPPSGGEEQETEEEDDDMGSDEVVVVKKAAAASEAPVKSEPGAKSKRRKKQEEQDDDVEIGGTDGDLDQELQQCADRLGQVPSCFQHLKPAVILEGKSKCGRSLDAATRQLLPSSESSSHVDVSKVCIPKLKWEITR